MNSQDLAQLVTRFINEKGDEVSPKKLQKLLYYIQAWHLVHLGKPLVDEEFEAWVHGPVLPSVYRSLKGHGFNNVRLIDEDGEVPDAVAKEIIRRNKLTQAQVDLIHDVLNQYGTFTAFQLEMLSHSEKPWLDARKGVKPHESCNKVISKDAMTTFYSQLLQQDGQASKQ